jgi:hypothetical protein
MISLACIPLMLIPKPIIIWVQSLTKPRRPQKYEWRDVDEIQDNENELKMKLK